MANDRKLVPIKDELPEDTDYLYCSQCKSHVPCRRIPTGGWEVECPGCSGECVICACHLRRFCFGSRDQFPPFEPERKIWPLRRNNPSH